MTKRRQVIDTHTLSGDSVSQTVLANPKVYEDVTILIVGDSNSTDLTAEVREDIFNMEYEINTPEFSQHQGSSTKSNWENMDLTSEDTNSTLIRKEIPHAGRIEITVKDNRSTPTNSTDISVYVAY